MQIQAVPASADGVVRDEILYMAHEYCDGGNLEQAIQAGVTFLPAPPAAAAVRQTHAPLPCALPWTATLRCSCESPSTRPGAWPSRGIASPTCQAASAVQGSS